MIDIKLVATDLDGTFLKDDRTISHKNIEALQLLEKKGIIRVAATGRNLHKVEEVINYDIPFDYIVFSSGAGIYDWKNKKHIYNKNINKDISKEVIDHLIGKDLNFHVFHPAPQNHKHWYHRGSNKCEEFERYFSFNNALATELNKNKIPETETCQFLIIIQEDRHKFESFKHEMGTLSNDIRVIRTSSPISKGYIWIEVFHNSVSKGNGVKYLCNMLNIDQKQTLGIGNDYNDIDLLDFTRYSFITENAPEEISNLYNKAPSNENDAFAFIINSIY